jgi:hypothetical protein
MQYGRSILSILNDHTSTIKNRTMKQLFTIAMAAIMLSSCTDALSEPHTVEMYSGGTLVRQWTSTGKVLPSQQSDEYYFRDSECHCNVEVSGDVVITRLK